MGTFELDYTAHELRAAMRLIDPTEDAADVLYEQIRKAPVDRPCLIPFRLGVTLTMVGDRLGRAAGAWLDRESPEVRADFVRERAMLERGGNWIT